eukprot:scaffold166252_cov14-Tisochrysis_lutea.AAC.1
MAATVSLCLLAAMTARVATSPLCCASSLRMLLLRACTPDTVRWACRLACPSPLLSPSCCGAERVSPGARSLTGCASSVSGSALMGRGQRWLWAAEAAALTGPSFQMFSGRDAHARQAAWMVRAAHEHRMVCRVRKRACVRRASRARTAAWS